MTTQYTMNLDTDDGTHNVTHLLGSRSQQLLSLILPRDVENVFGPGLDAYHEPERGYEHPEWYWVSSKKQVWGIGWRWGQARLRGRGMPNHGTELTKWDAIEFVNFLTKKLA